jgi:hypothetical protein
LLSIRLPAISDGKYGKLVSRKEAPARISIAFSMVGLRSWDFLVAQRAPIAPLRTYFDELDVSAASDMHQDHLDHLSPRNYRNALQTRQKPV